MKYGSQVGNPLGIRPEVFVVFNEVIVVEMNIDLAGIRGVVNQVRLVVFVKILAEKTGGSSEKQYK